MPNANDNARNKAALTFLGVLIAVAGGSYYLYASAAKDYIEARPVVASDAGYSDCWCGTVRANSELWTSLNLKRLDGGSGLAYACSCFKLPDGCRDAGGVLDDAGNDLCTAPDQTLPMGFEWTPADEVVQAWEPDTALLRIWTAENEDAPFRCACGATSRPSEGKCEKLVTPASLWAGYDAGPAYWAEASEDDMSLRPGEWRGGCKRHACSSWGESVTPAECCKQACKAGWECGTNKCGGSCGSCGDGLECKGHKCVAVPGPDAGPDLDAGRHDAGRDR